jgi:ABC-type proline/glycine betaine transport system permease subunit
MELKIIVFLFVYSLLIILRDYYFFNQAKRLGMTLEMNNTRLILLGSAISYFITILITGFYF